MKAELLSWLSSLSRGNRPSQKQAQQDSAFILREGSPHATLVEMMPKSKVEVSSMSQAAPRRTILVEFLV
jgi:hypothetical protein